jgi:hypothetical protein
MMIFFIWKSGDGPILAVVGDKYHAEFAEAEENSGGTFSRHSSLSDEQWSGLSESNRHLNLGKVPYYHYTKAAQRPSFYNMTARRQQAFPAHISFKANRPTGRNDQETWVMRADFTTGERRWRSAKRVALSLSV